jgi:hypothetical protein
MNLPYISYGVWYFYWIHFNPQLWYNTNALDSQSQVIKGSWILLSCCSSGIVCSFHGNPWILQTIQPLQHDRRIHEYYKQYHYYNMTEESMNTTNNTTTTTWQENPWTRSWILLSCCSGGIVCSVHGFSCHVVVVALFVVFMDSPVML